MHPPCCPTTAPYPDTALPSSGSPRVRFAGFPGTMTVLRRPPAFPPHFVASVRRYHQPHALFVSPTKLPWERIKEGLGVTVSHLGHPKPVSLMEHYGPPRFLGSPLVPLPRSQTPAAPALLCLFPQSGVAPATQTTKAAAFNRFSRLHHTASALAVYASRFGFPYTGKTRFRWVASPYRMGFEPIGLQSDFHVWWLPILSQRSRFSLARL